MEVISSWEGGYRCRTRVRGFEVVADEPPVHGGGDAGPMPTELLLVSLGSCFAMAMAHVARKRGIVLDDVEVRVTGEYDGPRFAAIRVAVTGSPSAHLDDLVARARRVCYVSNTLADPPQLTFQVGPSHDRPSPGLG